MKKAIILLFILPHMLIAQKEFAPIDATWRYEKHTFDCSNHFLRYNVENEIDINGKDCSVIFAYTSWHLQPFSKSPDSLIVWENDHKVYFYQFGDFHLLYDFTLEIGDTLDYFLPTGKGYFSPYEDEVNDTSVISTSLYIKDIEDVNINGNIHKKFDTRYTYPDNGFYHEMGYVVENVGSTTSKIIGQNEIFVASGCGPGFLCYENEDFSYPPNFSCEYPTSTKNIYSDNEIRFYPNPTFGDLWIINNTEEQIQRIEIVNMNGQKVAEFNSDNSPIVLEEVSKGFYVIKLKFDSGNHHIGKIVKY